MTDMTKPVEPVALPCPNPWCDCAKVYIFWDLYKRRVACDKCGLKGPPGADDAAAVLAWNDRPALDTANAEIERLKRERSVLVQSAKDVGASFRLALARAEKAEAQSTDLVAAARHEGWEAGMKDAAKVEAFMPGSGKVKPMMKPWQDAILAAIKENQP